MDDEEGYLFKNFDIIFYLGVFEFYLADYKHA